MIVTIPGYTTGEMQITGFNNFDLTAGVPVTAIAGTFNGTTLGGAAWIIPTTVSLDGFTVEKGLYVLHHVGADAMYISLVEWETIHPIDPKFLPNNVINMTELGLTKEMLFSNTSIPVGDDLTNLVKEVAANNEPLYIVFAEDGYETRFKVECGEMVTNASMEVYMFFGFGETYLDLKSTNAVFFAFDAKEKSVMANRAKLTFANA
jgi:hypothetical protein